MHSVHPLKIVHLVPHAGGGVGTVLRALLSRQNKVHKVALYSLEHNNNAIIDWCRNNSVEYSDQHSSKNKKSLISRLAQADIVHIHWWNHPLLHDLLAFETLPKMRSVIWSHVNGMYVPQNFFQSILSYPDRFIFATPQSFESQAVGQALKTHPCNFQVVQSNAGIPSSAPIALPERSEFRACYIGTVDYSKMHSRFISLWLKTGLKNKPLVVCGGPSESDLSQQITDQDKGEYFDVRGAIENVSEVLTRTKLFFYPLQRCHYGTGEQVLIEAMSFGVVPVVFSGGCEEYIVKDGETGIVANSDEEFIASVKRLYNDPKEVNRLAINAMEYVQQNFSIDHTFSKWETIYADLMTTHKKRHHQFKIDSFTDIPTNSPLALMLTTYGNTDERSFILKLFYGDTLTNSGSRFSPTFFARTRGTPLHYQYFFPEDTNLNNLCSKFILLRED